MTTQQAPLNSLLNSSADKTDDYSRPCLMITWSLGEHFGGMTAMCLKRASYFQRLGTPSAVVTFDPNPAFHRLVGSAVTNGRLSADVSVINLHEFYTENEPPKSARHFSPTDTSVIDWRKKTTTHKESDHSIFWIDYTDSDSDEVPLTRREYFRPDGSIYLVDCNMADGNDPRKRKRVLQLFRHDQTVGVEFSSAAQLYRYWLSCLVGSRDVDVIVDSKYSAGFLWNWNHPGMAKTVILHSTHIQAGEDPQTGAISPSHQTIADHRDSWDQIVFLTNRQREAFNLRFCDNSNTASVSNPVDGPTDFPENDLRESKKVVIVGRLTQNKSVDAAIDVIDTLNHAGIGATLHIIGDGQQREALEKSVEQRDLSPYVKFVGHSSQITSELQSANVALLCSRYEGQSLALLEAMAHGCVPVSFDVNFGPAEVISHKKTGFLVEDRSIEKMAQYVGDLLTDAALRNKMSRAAFDAAQKFRSPAIYREWKSVLESARSRSETRRLLEEGKTRLHSMAYVGEGQFCVTVDSFQLPTDTQVRLVLRTRGAVAEDAVTTLDAVDSGEGTWTFTVTSQDRQRHVSGLPLDLFCQLQLKGVHRTERLGTKEFEGPHPEFTKYGGLSLR